MIRLAVNQALLVALAAALLLAARPGGAVLALFTDVFSNTGNTISTDTLDPPTGLTASGGTSVTLNWTATADTYASGHRVLRGTTPGGPYSQIAEVTPRTTTTYVDSPASGTYYYVVRAFYQSWESANSNEASASVSSSVSDSFVSVADTWAQEDKPNDNYGTGNFMTVRSWSATKDARSFVAFDISSIPAGSTIDSATLTLCPTRVPGATRTYNLHRVTASWAETTLTWNNQPAVAGSVTDSATTPPSVTCMTWTVTADVQAWVDGTANNGWRVSDSVEGQGTKYWTEFRTRESSVTGERPKLDVTYTPP